MAKCKCCNHKLDVIFIERNQPNEVYSVYGDKHSPNPINGGMYCTYLERIELNPNWWFRTDIVLINGAWDKTGKNIKQWAVYPTFSGEPTGDGWDLLSNKEKDMARAINRRVLRVYEEYPQWDVMLHHN